GSRFQRTATILLDALLREFCAVAHETFPRIPDCGRSDRERLTASRPLQNDWVAGLGDRVTELRDSREVVTSRLQLILDHHLNALRKRRHESPIGELLLRFHVVAEKMIDRVRRPQEVSPCRHEETRRLP